MGFDIDNGWNDEPNCSEAIEMARYDAVEQFKKGTHNVFPDMSGKTGLPDDIYDEVIEKDGIFARIEYGGERGDSSVGLPGWEGWILADDQKGTQLAKLIDDANAVRKLKELFNNAPSLRSSDDYFLFVSEIEGILGIRHE